jgi:hypothetical protein
VFKTVCQGRSAVPYSADDFGRSGLRPLRDAVFFKAGARGLRWGLLGERGSADDAAPARHRSCRAERSEAETPLRIGQTRLELPPPPATGRVERNGVKPRHPHESAGHDRGCRLRGGLSTPPRRQSGLWSRRRWFLGELPPPPTPGRVERSAAQSRHLHESGGYERDRYLRGGLSTPPRQQSGLWSRRRWFVGGVPPPTTPGRVERSGAKPRHLLGCARSGRNRSFRGGLSTPPRQKSGRRSRRRGFAGVCLPRPPRGMVVHF